MFLFGDVDVLSGEIPDKPFPELPDIVKRSRHILKNRTKDEILYAIGTVYYMMYEDIIDADNDIEEKFINVFSYKELKACMGKFDIKEQDKFPNAAWVEYFAALSLAKIEFLYNAYKIHTLNYIDRIIIDDRLSVYEFPRGHRNDDKSLVKCNINQDTHEEYSNWLKNNNLSDFPKNRLFWTIFSLQKDVQESYELLTKNLVEAIEAINYAESSLCNTTTRNDNAIALSGIDTIAEMGRRGGKNRWRKKEILRDKAIKIAKIKWDKDGCDLNHAQMTNWLTNEYTEDDSTVPFMNVGDDYLRKGLKKLAKELGKPIKGINA